MGGKARGYRHKSRGVLTKKSTAPRGLTPLLREYKENEKVAIVIDPRQVKGMPHRRFQGRVGTIKKVMRRSLLMHVPVGGKVMKVIARNEHVHPHEES